MPVIATVGTVAGYNVTVNRRPAVAQDGLNGPSAVTVTLSNGANTYDVSLMEDTGEAGRQGITSARTLIAGFAAIGATTSLGSAGQTPATPGSPLAGYSRAVTLTPGTPVAPGRAAMVKGGGTFLLKLANGGSIPASDPSNGSGTLIKDVAVVDADVTGATNPVVSILY